MKKRLYNLLIIFFLTGFSLLSFVQKLSAQAAPERYEGVMLQAFFWDSQKETSWTSLKFQSDEIAKSFSLIWLPPSGNDLRGDMGYHPVYYFDQNSAFGTQQQLISLVSSLKSKGCLSIADIVVNHRNGVSNWTDFPVETYKGIRYVWGPETICKDDEVANQPRQPKPTGNWDTGEGWSGARDIDHTNQNVRNTIKAYLDFLKNEIGYAGWRYDVAKGYSAYYMGEYSKASGCEFSVGEYWDGGFDALATYINGTKIDNQISTGAFDFSLKYLLNEACNNGAWNKLVWKKYGVLEQPAGLIHSDGFARFAYTFVDNHDTWRPGTSAHAGAVVRNELAANAFILSHPGIPCVFYPHWRDYKASIKPMIEARNSVGIHNQSEVKVLATGNDIYAAEITGKKGSLIVKVGPRYNFTVPSGYILKCTGENYAIWTKGGSETVEPPIKDNKIVIKWDNAQNWNGDMYAYLWDVNQKPLTGAWPGTKITPNAEGKYRIEVNAKSVNAIFNNKTLQTVDIANISSDACYSITSNKNTKGYNEVRAVDCTSTPIDPETPNLMSITWENTQNWAGDMYVYVWDMNQKALAGTWPGTKVVPDANGKYSYQINALKANVIFNNRAQQTADITGITEDVCYIISSDKNEKGYNIAKITTCGTTPEQSTVVGWDNAQNWAGDMYIYVWDSNQKALAGAWPGTKVARNSDGRYAYILPSVPVNVIFTNGSQQTVDISNVNVSTCFTISNLKTGNKFNAQTTDCVSRVLKSSIADIEKPIYIYPNPAKDLISIYGADDVNEVNILTLSGQVVYTIKGVKDNLNISKLSSGMYIVVVKTTKNEKFQFKLLKK